MKYINYYTSPLGKILLASDGERLTGLWFEGQKHFAQGLNKNPEVENLPVFTQSKHWLDIYFSGEKPDFTPALQLIGTQFQIEVWNILREIPYGKIITYKDIAEKLSARKNFGKMSARAAGGAVGRNKISIIIPCHRVIASDGSLTGYAGGLERKTALLHLEKAEIL